MTENTNTTMERDPEQFLFCIGEDHSGNLRMACSYGTAECERVFEDREHCTPMDMEAVGYAMAQMTRDFEILNEFVAIVERIKANDPFIFAGYDGKDPEPVVEDPGAPGEVAENE